MDTTENYIRMCEKAEEIQNLINLVGKYAVWKCNKCGIVKEHMISSFTTSTNELLPTCGWACRECGMKGRMVFQELIKT